MKIVSWNIHRCFGTDGRYRPDRIAQVLKLFDADIIALQEVDSSLFASNKSDEDQLSYLARESGMHAVMGPTLTFDYGSYGNALLSRSKIDFWEEFDLSYRKVEPRGALAVNLTVSNNLKLRIVNTHLGLRYWERAFQIDQLLSQMVWRSGYSSILLGDFNEWIPFLGNRFRLERSFEIFSPRLATFPSGWPKLVLDRIFFSAKLKSLNCSVPRNELTTFASDHLPIVASFDL